VRLNQSIDTARDTVTTAIQVNLGMIAIGESEVTKRLAAYAALVAVPTMVAGHLRHELQAHAGARLDVRLPRSPSR
jgi:Mg2+ and Co2+ transporter CorA